MRVLKILNVILLLFTVYQFYNFKVIFKYSIDDQKLNTEYFYKEGRISKLEYEKELSSIEKERKKIILYKNINQFLLIINLLFFIYWFIYSFLIKKK